MKDNKTGFPVGRLTKRKLIKWVNDQFLKFRIKDYEVYKIEQTRFRSQDYEGGACSLYIWFKPVNSPFNSNSNTGYFISFYKLRELDMYAKNGYKIYLNFNSKKYMSLINLEIDVMSTHT